VNWSESFIELKTKVNPKVIPVHGIA